MRPLSPERRLGEYLLASRVSETATTVSWIAEQESVGRRVLVEELHPDQEDQRAAFLADVRAKAAVEHPLVGSVYEAVNEPDHCYAAYELLTGATLQDRLLAREPFEPARLAHILRRICDAQLQHEALGQACSPLDPSAIHVDDHGVVRLQNLARAGARDPDRSAHDVAALGAALVPLVADGRPGATRMLTLLGWMRGEQIAAPLTWEQVRDYCNQIEQQLSAPVTTTAPTQRAAAGRGMPTAGWLAIAGVIALAVVLLLALQMRSSRPKPARPAASLPDAVLIPAGRHPTPDGTREPLERFRIACFEVTIGQYAEFLETLNTLTAAGRERTFDHEDQPATKTSHLPDDWESLIAAARAGTAWNGRPVSLDHPVVGVDWWDASAYAEWKQGRLPTQEEWFAALSRDVEVPAAIPPSPWVSVASATNDRTPLGLLGMAGSVAEWTRRPAVNPANPLGERKWLVIGGSFLRPGTNALTREWLDDRSIRRPDLGFRLVFDAPPEKSKED